MRRALLPLGVTLVGGLLGACQGTPSPADEPSPAAPAISTDASLKVVETYVHHYNKAIDSGSAKTWRGLVTGALGATAAAQVKENDGRAPRLRRLSLANPVMYVPRLRGYPKWFAVAALSAHGSRNEPMFLLFTRTKSTSSWRLADRVAFTGEPPRIAVDGQGYAVAVNPRSSGLAVRPAELPSAHAEYLESGNTVIASGRYTSDWVAAERHRETTARRRGVFVAGRYAPSKYPVYALRTTDGGALVWYSLERTETLVLTGGASTDAVPSEVRSYLNGTVGGQTVATWTMRAVAYVPVSGKVRVLFQSVDLVSAKTG